MNYIKVSEDDGAELKVAVTKKFKREYFKAKALAKNAKNKLKKIEKMPILHKEKLNGIMLNMFKNRAEKKLEKAKREVKKQKKNLPLLKMNSML